MHAAGSVMSEAYLAYTLNNTTAKIGRQYITTPLVAGSGSRMFKQSFEAFVLANTDIPNTTLVAAYVTKFQGRTSSNSDATDIGNAPDFQDYNDGAFTIYAKNTSVENLTLQAQYAQVKIENADDQKIAYLEANYKLNPVTISAQTIQSDNGAATASDGALYGIKVAAKVGMASLMAAYTTTDDEADTISGIGAGADKSYTAAYMTGGGFSDNSDTDSWKLGASTKVAGFGLGLTHTNWDDKNSNTESDATDFSVSYAYNKAASVTVKHAVFGGTYGETQDYRSRVYLSYKF